MNQYNLPERIVNTALRGITRIICRIDDEQLIKVPLQGPLILATNHVNFLEVPIVYTHLQPRAITGFAKAETWDNRLMAVLFNLWEAIPIERGEADLGALRMGLKALKEGQILAVAPEGTRSGDGRLRQGHPGIVFIALKSGAPILPIAVHGGEVFWSNIKQLKRTDFNLVVGKPFFLKSPTTTLSRDVRQKMVDEIMYQLARLLPAPYRGSYSDLERASEEYLEFLDVNRNSMP
jgi:1-acyl-sn-glycerol-3-phosphate acyltransferase